MDSRPYKQGPYTSYLLADNGEDSGDVVGTEEMVDEGEILENEYMVDSWSMIDDSMSSLEDENNEESEPSYYYYYYYDESGIDISNELE